MGIGCFLLERVNEVRVEHEPCAEHGGDCSRAEGWSEVTFDVRRVDTGQILKSNVTWIEEGGLEPGAMWWATTIGSHRPTAPDDWSDRPPEDWDRLKREVIEHPEWFPAGALPTGLPVRRPSHTFDDAPQLHVMTPGGAWNIDSRASNCGLPYDYAHRCWIRHGDPPTVTVDKDGRTCAAGAGSIQCGSYHGFLRAGELVT